MKLPTLLILGLGLPACFLRRDDPEEDDTGSSDGGVEETFSYRALILLGDYVNECTDDCPADVQIYPCGEMTNNTDVDQTVETPTSCLVENWVISGAGGTEELSYYCDENPSEYYFQPKETMLRCSSEWTGEAGDYGLTVNFATGDSESIDFTLN